MDLRYLFPRKVRTGGLLLGSAALLAVAWWGMAKAQPAPQSRAPYALIEDWSHRYLIFTDRAPRVLSFGPQQNARVWLAWLRRAAMLSPKPSVSSVSSVPTITPRKRAGFKVDWNVDLVRALSQPAGSGVAHNMYPAKYSFNVLAPPHCTNDFVVFPINQAPSTIQANIAAFNQLYRAPTGYDPGMCGNGEPGAMWAYRVGSGPVRTSPVLSLTGSKVAFVEHRNGSGSYFHVLTWQSGQGTTFNPVLPANGSLKSVQYSASANTRSSPFVDYDADTAYVGADNGVLYKIGPVFGGGDPAVLASVTVNAGLQLTAPVLDSTTGIVFVSDSRDIWAYDTSLTYKGQVTISAPGGITDPLMVDASNRYVYAVSSSSGPNAVAIQAEYVYGSGNLSFQNVISARIGSATGNPVHMGALDEAYYATGPSTGSLWVCGNQGSGKATLPGLYRFTFFSGGMMNPTPALNNNPNINTVAGQCSPLTSFYNRNVQRQSPPPTGTEFLFLGYTNNKIELWDITKPNSIFTSTTPATPCATSFPTTQLACYQQVASTTGGTSGIVVDNASTASQAASIYFGSLGLCGSNRQCAAKMTQLTLE